MFNLLVRQRNHYSPQGWPESGTYAFERERVFEYTNAESVAEYFDDIQSRRNLPCLFSYEGTNDYGRVGRISSISERDEDVAISYSLDARFPEIPIHDDATYRKFGCGRWEQGRTHWAVKNIDLFETVLEVLASRIPSYSADGTRMDELWGGHASVHYARVFLSHRAKDGKDVSKVAEELRALGHRTFVAHDDIPPTKEWRDEILYALNTMTHFVGLITDDFHEGGWTDQEVGYSFARTDVRRILLKLSGSDPKGLASFEQAATADWAKAARRISELMGNDP